MGRAKPGYRRSARISAENDRRHRRSDGHIIKIMNEFLRGPVWTCDMETGIVTGDLPLAHDVTCWFDEECEKADKPRILELLRQPNARIAELNDGSFVVDDQETLRVKTL